MKDQRRDERRTWAKPPEYPFIDADGIIVYHNRRRIVERRRADFMTALISAEIKINATRLLLCHHDRTEVVSEVSPRLLAGRSVRCDVRISKGFISRKHILFEYRRGSFYIIDHSTNGTYLRWDQGKELHLMGDEMRLTGSGLISLGCPISPTEERVIRFRCRRE
jgi:hypothetical protein